MGFDLEGLLAERRGEGYALHAKYIHPQMQRMLHTIGFDTEYVRGEGPFLYDADGNEYLDLLSGFGVMALGRNHPVVRHALHQVLDGQLADMVKFDCAPLPGLLAEKLLARAPHLDRVFFGNSGSEAVETALKFARYATGRGRILYLNHAFHGLTTGSLSVNGDKEFREGFGPLLPDTALEFGDLDGLERELRKGDVAALLFEPIQGHGMVMPPPGYLTSAQDLLRKHGALLIADEVQTGMGRTGAFFAYEHEGVEPDLVTVAKALSGGFVPVSALLGKDWIFQKVYSSMERVLVHSTTYTGNAMAMVAGLATMAVYEDEDIIGNVNRVGGLWRSRLEELVPRYELLSKVHGRGLMLGFEFGRPNSLKLRTGWSMLQKARKGLFAQMVVVPLYQRHRILTQVSGDYIDVVKLLPPLNITEKEVDRFMDAFVDVMDDAHKGTGLMWDFGRTLIKQAVTR